RPWPTPAPTSTRPGSWPSSASARRGKRRSAMPRADRARQVPVVIVGAGPAGLGAGGTLGRNGNPSLRGEPTPGLSPLPRATSVSTRTMALLRSWGLEAEVRAGQLDITAVGAWAAETLASPGGPLLPPRHPDL